MQSKQEIEIQNDNDFNHVQCNKNVELDVKREGKTPPGGNVKVEALTHVEEQIGRIKVSKAIHM